MMLSIAMIVKNEENNLERTLIPLKELKKYIDTEIVIVDTGSTDSTVDIAKKYTDKVYYHPWNDDFAAMRNISISYCTGDWILVVDADEVLYDVKALSDLVKKKDINKYNSIFIKLINFTKDIDSSLNNGAITPLLRLFQKGKIKYEGTVHEQPIIEYPVLDSNIRFIHYGYDNNDYRLMEYKFKRNLKLLKNELKRNPDNIYIIFQIAASYTMHNDLSDALKYIELAYEKAKHDLEKFIYVLDKYCFILHSVKDYSLLLEKSEEALRYNKSIDFYYYRGDANYNLSRYNEAIDCYNNYIDSYRKLENNEIVFSSTLSITTKQLYDVVLYNLGLCYFKTSKYEKALDIFIKIEDRDLLKNKIHAILQIISKGKLYNHLKNVNGLLDKYNYENVLFLIHKEFTVEALQDMLSTDIEDKNLKEILVISKDFKENGCLSKTLLNMCKEIIDENKMPYTIYVYFILKSDFKEIYSLLNYGTDILGDILVKLCTDYFDFNSMIIKQLKEIKVNSIRDVIVKCLLEKATLLAKKLPQDEKKEIFLNYIADKYCIIINSYSNQVLKDNRWMLPSEDRFIIELKEALSNKYIDFLKYIKMLKNNLNIDKSYTDYIKLLIEDDKNVVYNNELKAFVPELVKSVEQLINEEKYEEAYNAIEESLSLVNFNLDLMILKYNLLLKFNYEEEAKKCLRDIILYGESERVKKLISFLN